MKQKIVHTCSRILVKMNEKVKCWATYRRWTFKSKWNVDALVPKCPQMNQSDLNIQMKFWNVPLIRVSRHVSDGSINIFVATWLTKVTMSCSLRFNWALSSRFSRSRAVLRNFMADISLSSSSFQRFFLLVLLRFYDGTALNSGQRLDNVCRTHLVQASGQLVLQKKLFFPFQLTLESLQSKKTLEVGVERRNKVSSTKMLVLSAGDRVQGSQVVSLSLSVATYSSHKLKNLLQP